MIEKKISPSKKQILLREKIGIQTISEMFERKSLKYNDLTAFTHITKAGI